MCSLRSIKVVTLSLPLDSKAAIRAARFFSYGVDRLHPRPRRAVVQCPVDTRHRLIVAFDQRFDTSIGQVANPSGDAFPHRRVLGKPAEAHTLNASADHEPPRDAHVREAPIIPSSESARD